MKGLTRDEFINWIENSKLPLKLSVTQLTEDLIILRRCSNENQGLTIQQEIMLREIFTEDN